VKSRDGFVSNSSSSSFLILGCKVSDVPEPVRSELRGSWESQREFLGEDFWCHDDCSAGDEVVGLRVGEWSEYGPELDLPYMDLIEGLSRVVTKLKVSPQKVKLIGGTYSC
jgi:hypothetical protein